MLVYYTIKVKWKFFAISNPSQQTKAYLLRKQKSTIPFYSLQGLTRSLAKISYNGIHTLLICVCVLW